jgi:CHASE2 domain-containing sensor protein
VSTGDPDERPAESDRSGRGPYQGLTPYREEDAAYFFGRDADRDVVLDNLLAYRVSILYGPSGVGKSSLLRAGVARHVSEEGRQRARDGRPAEYAAVVFSSWAEDPVRGLKRAIADALEKITPKLGSDLPEGSLADVIRAAADRVDGSLLIVLDQFEESFLYGARDGERNEIPDELALAIVRRETPANFVISIREDAVAQLDRLAGAIPNLLDNLIRVDNLDRASAREAIERPIERWNRLEATEGEAVRIEPQLVEAVLVGVETGKVLVGDTGAAVADLGGAFDGHIQTPYLQLVLTRLWDEERASGSRTLRLTTLERLGGAERIVATHLDAVMAALPRRDQVVAAQLFRYLVTPSGTKIAHRSKDLAEYAELPETTVTPILERLTRDARILQPVGESRYQITHDALAAPILEWRRRSELRQRRRRERRRLFAIVCFAAVAVALLALGNGLDPLELGTVDARFSIRGSQTPPKDLVMVTIDDATREKLGQAWPYPRSLHGDAIDRVARDRPKVIAYDVQFTEPRRLKEDISLAEAIAGARRRTVLVTSEVFEGGRTTILSGDETLRAIGATPAHSLLPTDPGGEIRRLEYAVDQLKTLAVVGAETATRRRVDPDGFDDAWIDYYGPPGTIDSVSFWSVVRGKVRPGFFRNKLVVVGPTSPSIGAVYETPTTDDRLMSETEIQATALDTVRRGLPLKDAPEVLNLALIALFALLPPLVSLRLPLIHTIAVALAAAVVLLVAAQLAFDAGTVLLVVYPLGALLVSTLAVVLVGVAAPGQRRAA